MRKLPTIPAVWNEYVALIKRCVPRVLGKRVLTPRAGLVFVFALLIEAIVALGIYAMWFQKS